MIMHVSIPQDTAPIHPMAPATQQQLLQLNRDFYATVAGDFDITRGGLPIGWRQLRAWLPAVEGRPLRVLDVGCGNGRFARLLAEWGIETLYVGVDADARLLAFAQDHATGLTGVNARFIQADFTTTDWPAGADLQEATFDLVVCFAALHHVPGYQLRTQCIATMSRLVASTGVLLLSHWQFLTSTRFVRKQIAWQTIGLSEADVEPGDALLPWNQGAYAIRYVHQVDPDEASMLAAVACMQIVEQYYADGKEGNLNLYMLLRWSYCGCDENESCDPNQNAKSHAEQSINAYEDTHEHS